MSNVTALVETLTYDRFSAFLCSLKDGQNKNYHDFYLSHEFLKA